VKHEWVGHGACIGDIKMHTNVEWEISWKENLGRHRHRLEDNIRIYLRETACRSEKFIELTQDRVH